MKLKPIERFQYAKNPLVEVLVQLRFPRLLQIQEQLPLEFQNKIASDYPILEVLNEALSVVIGGAGSRLEDIPASPIYNFSSADKCWRISLASDYLALSCSQYQGWEDFKPRFTAAINLLIELYPIKFWTRLGLRYRDLIVREDIGLEGRHWRDLISSHLLGFAIADEIADSERVSESDVLEQQGFVNLRLEYCNVGLRHGLIKRQEDPTKTAYMIDSDFYVDKQNPEGMNVNAVGELLEQFHANAGSLFRGCIQDELHEAMEPKKIKP
ncbi:TIGR04255 family protein [Polynucleobacter sp. Fuers-14]|uniref:TIGR04255 family protein n=1 Tax=Polynucleobacter sp. Fuers-14 TaxID=1758364 RepID=UPI001C0CD612|nr:TIGR04255 family protein [Polynucleobacter sp. Fuers-14]MBU3641626.1 TIGR04255 family protein [Polynucleobacter sp. Fuers-14]